MDAVATAVWGAGVAFVEAWPGKAKPDAASCVGERLQAPWREIRKRWAEIVQKLQDILKLEDDWDGAGAKKPDPRVINFCIELANGCADRNMQPASCVSPTVEGGAVFQWQGEGCRLEVEFNEPYRAECMLSIRGQKPKHWVIG